MISDGSPLYVESSLEIPGFVREVSGAAEAGAAIARRYNFWLPTRSGHPSSDYSAGRRNFEEAVAFAHQSQNPRFIVDVMGAISSVTFGPVAFGPIEHGFIDALSCKAIYGKAPDVSWRATQDDLGNLALSPGALKSGEMEAKEIIDIARSVRRPDIISEFMTGMFSRGVQVDDLPFAMPFVLWICAAAYAGAMN